MEQSTESGDVSIRNLGGLNERISPLDLPPNEFSVLEGYYPSQQGLLSRLPGKEKLFQLVGRVMSIHPTYNSSGHVLIQTDENLYLTTIDEIQGRTISTSLTLNPDPDPGGTSSGDTTPPTTPTNVAASAVTSGTLTLTWTPSTDDVAVTSYSVYYRISPAAFALYGITTINTLAFVGLTAATTYDFYVTASDAAGNISANSITYSVATLAGGGDVTPPTAPGSLSLVSSTTTTIALTWIASTDAVGVTGYIIYDRLGTSGSFTQAGTVAANTFTVTGLASNTAYDFQVKAFDAAGNISSASNTLSAITNDGGPPPPPTASEIIIYYKTAAGINGYTDSNPSGSSVIITDISIPSGAASFLISNNSTQIQLPAGSYLFDCILQHYSTAVSTKFVHGVAGSFASDSSISPASDIIKTTRSVSLFSPIASVFVSVFASTSSTSTTTHGFAVNLGEIETYMVMKITRLS